MSDGKRSKNFRHLVKYKGRMVEVGGKPGLTPTGHGNYETKAAVKKKVAAKKKKKK